MDNSQLSMKEAMRLASSPAGRQLYALLNQQDSNAVQKAMASAASGDYEQAKNVLAAMLSDPKAQQLLKELGR